MTDACSGPELPCKLHAQLVPFACHQLAIVWQCLHGMDCLRTTLTLQELSTRRCSLSKLAAAKGLQKSAGLASATEREE